MTIQPDNGLSSHATGSFATLPGATAPEVALSALGDLRFVVVVDGDVASALLTADAVTAAAAAGLSTIASAGVSPCIIAPEQTTFAEFCDSASITLLDLGADAIVLVDDRDQVTGVLPVSAIHQYLGSGAHTPEPTEMGPHGATDDDMTHGDPRLPFARVLCREPGCGFVNVLPYYDPMRPPLCRNTSSRHRLRTGL
jgi:hypothetical protein